MNDFNKLDRLIGLTKIFPDIDKELILLAIDKNSIRDERKLRERYAIKRMDYQTLEYLGDSVLDLITNSFVIDRYDLSLNGKEYNFIKSEFVRNNNLTQLSIDLGICDELFPDYDIRNKHNICSDTLEAIIGAIWLQYRDSNIEKIKNWFFGIPIIYSNIIKIIGIEEENSDDIPSLETLPDDNSLEGEEFFVEENPLEESAGFHKKSPRDSEEFSPDKILKKKNKKKKNKNKKEEDDLLDEALKKEEELQIRLNSIEYAHPSHYETYVARYDPAFFVRKTGEHYFLTVIDERFEKIIDFIGHKFIDKKELQKKVDKFNRGKNEKFILSFGKNDYFSEIYDSPTKEWWGIFLTHEDTVYTLSNLVTNESDYLFYESFLIQQIHGSAYDFNSDNLLATTIKHPVTLPDTISGFTNVSKDNISIINYANGTRKTLKFEEAKKLVRKLNIKYFLRAPQDMDEEEIVNLVVKDLTSRYKNIKFSYFEEEKIYNMILILPNGDELFSFLSLRPINEIIFKTKKIVWTSSIIQRLVSFEILDQDFSTIILI